MDAEPANRLKNFGVIIGRKGMSDKKNPDFSQLKGLVELTPLLTHEEMDEIRIREGIPFRYPPFNWIEACLKEQRKRDIEYLPKVVKEL